jgi:glycosyltransferase involved in cell wall biosynthesis
MRIVHIITRLILGGAQENTLITCKLLARRGHDVTLITGPALGPEGDLYDQARNQDFRLIILESLRRHSAKAGVLGRFAAYNLRRATRHGERGTRIVHTIHGLAFHPYQSDWLNKFYIAVERAAAKRTDFFISVADAMTNQALAAGIGRAGQFVTAYSAIEEEDFLSPIPQKRRRAFRRKYEIPEDGVVLVSIARLFMLKGHDYIIESARELSRRFDKAVWLFVGDGNLTDHYKRQVSELGLSEKVKFTGLLPPGEIPLAIESSDILVHCSLREGLARTLPQAMLCGRPAVSFDVDGAREVVNQKTGRLIEPKNVGQLTDACAELIGDGGLRERLGAAGRESVKDRFAPDKMVDTIEDVYLKLLP